MSELIVNAEGVLASQREAQPPANLRQPCLAAPVPVALLERGGGNLSDAAPVSVEPGHPTVKGEKPFVRRGTTGQPKTAPAGESRLRTVSPYTSREVDEDEYINKFTAKHLRGHTHKRNTRQEQRKYVPPFEGGRSHRLSARQLATLRAKSLQTIESNPGPTEQRTPYTFTIHRYLDYIQLAADLIEIGRLYRVRYASFAYAGDTLYGRIFMRDHPTGDPSVHRTIFSAHVSRIAYDKAVQLVEQRHRSARDELVTQGIEPNPGEEPCARALGCGASTHYHQAARPANGRPPLQGRARRVAEAQARDISHSTRYVRVQQLVAECERCLSGEQHYHTNHNRKSRRNTAVNTPAQPAESVAGVKSVRMRDDGVASPDEILQQKLDTSSVTKQTQIAHNARSTVLQRLLRRAREARNRRFVLGGKLIAAATLHNDGRTGAPKGYSNVCTFIAIQQALIHIGVKCTIPEILATARWPPGSRFFETDNARHIASMVRVCERYNLTIRIVRAVRDGYQSVSLDRRALHRVDIGNGLNLFLLAGMKGHTELILNLLTPSGHRVPMFLNGKYATQEANIWFPRRGAPLKPGDECLPTPDTSDDEHTSTDSTTSTKTSSSSSSSTSSATSSSDSSSSVATTKHDKKKDTEDMKMTALFNNHTLNVTPISIYTTGRPPFDYSTPLWLLAGGAVAAATLYAQRDRVLESSTTHVAPDFTFANVLLPRHQIKSYQTTTVTHPLPNKLRATAAVGLATYAARAASQAAYRYIIRSRGVHTNANNHQMLLRDVVEANDSHAMVDHQVRSSWLWPMVGYHNVETRLHYPDVAAHLLAQPDLVAHEALRSDYTFVEHLPTRIEQVLTTVYGPRIWPDAEIKAATLAVVHNQMVIRTARRLRSTLGDAESMRTFHRGPTARATPSGGASIVRWLSSVKLTKTSCTIAALSVLVVSAGLYVAKYGFPCQVPRSLTEVTEQYLDLRSRIMESPIAPAITANALRYAASPLVAKIHVADKLVSSMIIPYCTNNNNWYKAAHFAFCSNG